MNGGTGLATDTGATPTDGDKLLNSVIVLPSTAAMSGDATVLVTASTATPNSKETSVNLLPSAAANQLTRGLADTSSLLDTVNEQGLPLIQELHPQMEINCCTVLMSFPLLLP